VTERIRLGFGVTLTPHPFTPPMRVAEKVATTDILSKGRVEWGTGRSTPMEQTAFGVDRQESRGQWKEAIEAIVQMWDQEYFEFHGKYLDFPRRMVTPRPYQDPHPPCWMAANSNDSAALAGKYGLGLLSFTTLKPLEELKKQVDQYREAARNPEPLTNVTQNKIASYTLVHCTPTMADAEEDGIWESVLWWYQNLAEFTIEWELPHLPPQEQAKAFPELQRSREEGFNPRAFNDADMIIVGTPEQCIEKMKRYVDIGVDELICYKQFGHLSHDSIMRSLELIGREVMPEIEAYSRKAAAKRQAIA
jgi:alkanesulfonate monooxygenase SsuD/methylene tetrahydromethanopterin reductase-like flavin-dependent oxidoreductase (luciferase family)